MPSPQARPRRLPALHSATLALLVAAAACDTTAPAVVASVDVSLAVLHLDESEQHQLEAQPRSSGGGVISGVHIAWDTRNPLVASVSSAGLVTAVGPGQTWIVAQASGTNVADSVLLEVFPVANMNTVRVVGPADLTRETEGGMFFLDRLGTTEDYNVLLAQGQGALILGFFPGDRVLESTSLAMWGDTLLEREPWQFDLPVLQFVVSTATGQQAYILVGQLHVVEADAPPFGVGVLRARGTLMAHRVDAAADPVPVSFAATLGYFHVIVGRFTGTIGGVELSGDIFDGLGVAELASDGVFVIADGFAGPSPAERELVELTLWRETRTTGTFDVDSIGSDEARGFAPLPPTAAVLDFLDRDMIGAGRSGTVQITAYSAPTASMSGEIAGTANVVFDNHTFFDGVPLNTASTAVVEFHLPVLPPAGAALDPTAGEATALGQRLGSALRSGALGEAYGERVGHALRWWRIER